MEKTKRRRLFYLLIVAFVFTAPILILYSFGYTFNLDRKEVELKGGIFIKSRTPRLKVILNNEFVKETSLLAGGTLLTAIKPATHILRLEKEGYQPWTKIVTIEPSVVTELRNIILLPLSINPATSTAEEALRFKPPSFNHSIIGGASATTSAGVITLNKKGELVARSATSSKILFSNVHSYSIFQDTIFWVDNNGFLTRFFIPEERLEILGRPGFFLNKSPLRFMHIPGGSLAILDGGGGLYLFNSKGELVKTVEGKIVKMSLDSRGEKALLLKEFEVKVLWLKDNPYQPFQKKGTLENILTLQMPLQDAHWFFLDSAHILLQTEEGIFLTELDGRGGRFTAELFPKAVDEIFTSREAPHAIFFRNGKTWFKIEL